MLCVKKSFQRQTLGRGDGTKHYDPGFPAPDVAFSSDGRYIASTRFNPNLKGNISINLWDFAKGKLIFERDTGSIVCEIALTPDGKYLASVDDEGLKVWGTAIRRIGDVVERAWSSHCI